MRAIDLPGTVYRTGLNAPQHRRASSAGFKLIEIIRAADSKRNIQRH